MARVELPVHDEEQALLAFEKVLEGVWRDMVEEREECEGNWRELVAVGVAKCIASIDEELSLSPC